MKQEILDRIKELAGNTDNVKNLSLQEDLQAITFTKSLYPHELWGTELYGIDEYYENNIQEYEQDKDLFYRNLAKHFFNPNDDDYEVGYGQMFYEATLFTPYKEGSFDFTEWNDIFTDEEEVDLSEIYKVTDEKKPDFIKIIYSNSYPDHFYICTSDTNSEDPTVFGTDHEVFFKEISNEGTLSKFLEQFYTEDEFLKIVTNYIDNEKTGR
ncbi:hypothetical protein [Pedobacter caeni]|uniref:Uncharacterized protein n=1 Tax=Pedobacter caeni TaxID=288992 RepID=A0A1M4V2Z6_9SPHI|nr:hypothetical protein [Pedobacter caeni]SHE63364.1 hypothetical protein SAMN04488522_101761 [Pedobacter caeni]